MKKKFSFNKLKFIYPVLILLLGIGSLISFEFYLKPMFNKVETIVAVRDIQFKQKITNEDVKIQTVNKDDHVEGSFSGNDLNKIIGSYASITIKKGTQIYPELIDSFDLIPNEKKGEFVAPIPNSWIYAVPGSLRRTFLADIYAIGDAQNELLESLIKDSQQPEEKQKDEENQKEVTNELPKGTEQADSFVTTKFSPILKDIRVAYVKDRSNKEVTNSQENPNSATSNISELEIIATDEMLQIIKEEIAKGKKLYIVYDFDRGNENDKGEDKE